MKDLRKIITSIAVFSSVVLSPAQVYAEDTEIYFSNPESTGEATIVMLLDTSGSMETNSCVEWDEFGTCIRKAKRMDELKTALFRVVDALASNVRMGIGRYNQNDGGRLIYPVRGLDEIDFEGVSEFTLLSDAADGDDAPGEGTDYSSRYENLPVGYDAGGVMGFVFEDTQIPRHASVSAAYLQVTASQNSNFNADFTYWYEDVPSSNLLDVQEIIGRPVPATTYAGLIDEDWSRYGRYKIDITDGVQAALERADWCGGNNLGLFMTGPQAANGSDREIYMRDALREGAEAEYYAPRLIIEWDAEDDPTIDPLATDYEAELACRGNMRFTLGTKLDDAYDTGSAFGNEDGDNLVGPGRVTGMRFTRIPFFMDGVRPDVLNEAILHLQGDNNNKDFDLTVTAVPGDTPAFDPVPGYLKDLPTTAASETFSIAKGTFSGRFELDVTSVVDEAMKHADWIENGNLTLLLTATENADIDAFDAGAAIAPILELSVSSPSMAKFVPRARDRIKEAVAGLTAYGNTPSMESYAEMARYMLGKNYRWARADVYTEVGMIDDGPQYDSPLSTSSCDSNNIVLLTDGSPTNDADYAAVTGLTGYNTCNGGLNREGGSFNCQVQLAEWLYDGTQNGVGAPIATHTIAFTNDADINAQMARVSSVGNGLHRKGRNADELEAAFTEIINSVTVSNASMAAPGLAVNQLNRFEFLDTLYYGLFKPSTQTRWEGNVKRYRAGISETTGQFGVLDEAGVSAVDPNTGFFRDTANSFWGMVDDGAGGQVDTIDGAEVTLGGARQELNKQQRRLLINTTEPAPGGTAQVATEWTVASDLNPPSLGLPGSGATGDRDIIFQWLKTSWGDPLHSPPALITFGGPDTVDLSSINNADTLDNTVFVATNDGMLHAVNAKDGSEVFAWMPPGELEKMGDRFSNAGLSAPGYNRTTYGFDGGIGVWRKSVTGSVVDVEHVYLYLAQRRGGDKIYALDVTDRNAPVLKWVIDGGTGDYANLGQTWSTPAFARIKTGEDSNRPVIIFGGGYSPADHDANGAVSSTGDQIGNSIFIADAETGELLVEISDTGADVNHADMKWAISGLPSLVDFNLDGLVDQLFFGDLGGQLFRVDLDPAATSVGNSIARVQTIAKLGVSDGSGISNHRRFFASPSVAVATTGDGTRTYKVGIGSGYRAHPLDKLTQDRIFVINDREGFNVLEGTPSTTTTTVTTSDLSDLTDSVAESASGGFYIDLDKSLGEKAVSTGVFLGGAYIVGTYVPESNAIDRCTSVIGRSRIYAIGVNDGAGLYSDLFVNGGDSENPTDPDGNPVDPDGVQDRTGGDRATTGFSDMSIALAGGKVIIPIDTELMQTNVDIDGFEKTRWFQVFNETDLMQILEEGAGSIR